MQKLICELCGSNDFTKDDQGFFVCDYCRTKYTPEQAKSMIVEGTVRVDRSGDVVNLLSLAQTALSSGSHREAFDYANRVLEIDPESSTAWYIKGASVGWLSTLQELRLKEMRHSFEHSIRNATDGDRPRVQQWCAQQINETAVYFAKLSWDQTRQYASVDGTWEGHIARSEEILDSLVFSYQWYPRPEPIEWYAWVASNLTSAIPYTRQVNNATTTGTRRATPEYLRITNERLEWALAQLDHLGGGYAGIRMKPAHWLIGQSDYIDLAIRFPKQVAQILAEDSEKPLKRLSLGELNKMIKYLEDGRDYSFALRRVRPFRRQ